MKQGRFTSLLLVITLMASVVAGAMGVFCSVARADDPSTHTGYFDDLVAEARLDCNTNFLTKFDQYTQYMKDNFDDLLICVIHDDDTGNWYFGSFLPNQSNYTWGWLLNSDNTFYRFYSIKPDNNYNYGMYSQYCFKLNNGSYTDSGNFHSVVNYITTSNVDYSSTGRNYMVNPNITGTAGRKAYVNKDIPKYKDLNRSDYITANLVSGTYIEPISEYQLIDFYIGNRRYLSIDDQEVIRWVWRQENDCYFSVANYYDDQGTIADAFYWTDDDLIFIPNGDQYGDFYNVSNQGIYAVDITYLPVGFFYIDVSFVYEILPDESSVIVGYATNVPFYLNLDKPQENYVNNYNTYVQYFQEYNEFYEEYLNNYVLPETDLPSYIKNLNHDPAASTACEVISTGSHVGEVTIVSEVFTWHPNTYLVCDSEMFWPGGGFNQYFEPEILNSVDVVLVVQHDDYMSLFEYTDQNNIKHYDTDFLANAIIFYHTENFNGIDKFSYWYVAQENTGAVAPYDTVKAYCFFTSHYINHVQNMILADGITSICNWLDEFSKNKESETAAVISGIGAMTMAVQTFNDSLNLWATQPDSFFFQVIDKLDAINSKLDSIGLTLERIADNTDEDQEPMWYESLWNWVRQFTPSENAFITGLNAIDDGFDNMPLLPVPSSYPNYPLLPTFTPTPSPDPGGG